MTEWRDIKDFEGLYQISTSGEVKSVERIKQNNLGFQKVNERIRKLSKDKDGYLQVCLSKEGRHYLKKIHRLVAEAFLPNPDNLPVINHKNENKEYNRVENLEWCTVKYNTNYGNGITKMAITQGRPVLQLYNGYVIEEFYSTQKASKETGVPQANIYKVCVGERRTAGGYEWRFKDEY